MRTKELAKKSAPRVDVGFIPSLGIQSYGSDNLYPNIVRQIIQASATGSQCCARFAEFIEGNGLRNEENAALIVNRHGETLDDLHRKISNDIAVYNGFAIHVGYNILGEACELEHVPFECCRLSEPDEYGIVSSVLVHPDWSGKTMRGGKVYPVKKENVQTIHKYNPLREVVLSQMAACGGAEYYRGQILYFSKDGEMQYPISRADSVLTEMSTDEGISNIKYRNVRNNFFPAGMLITKTSQNTDGEYTDGFSDEFEKLQTDTQCVRILEVAIESEEDKPEFVPISGTNYDKEFSVTEESTTARIYRAYSQEPFYCISIGKTGFSGQIVADAFSVYNSSVAPYQRIIERTLSALFRRWYAPVDPDFSVEPLVYIANK